MARIAGRETLMGTTSNHGRRYDDEFKQQAVLLVVRDGLSQRRAANDLGVSEPTLARWVEEYRRSACFTKMVLH